MKKHQGVSLPTPVISMGILIGTASGQEIDSFLPGAESVSMA